MQLTIYDLPSQTQVSPLNGDFFFEGANSRYPAVFVLRLNVSFRAESVVSISRNTVDAAGADIVVTGFGFAQGQIYQCIVTALPTGSAYTTAATVWSDIIQRGYTTIAENYTYPFRYSGPNGGVCAAVGWPDAVGKQAFFTVLHISPALSQSVVASQRITFPVPLFTFAQGAIDLIFFSVTLIGATPSPHFHTWQSLAQATACCATS